MKLPKIIHWLYRFMYRLLFLLLVLTGLYLVLAVIGTLIPVNTSYLPANEGIPIFITTNGFHTDIVLPVQNRRDKCFQVLNAQGFRQSSAPTYIGFGWGDRDFYMESYQRSFPSALTVLDALFEPSETLMHINFYQYPLKAQDSVKALVISPEQYEKLVNEIHASFRQENGQYLRLPQPGYGPYDFFFEANGKYQLFNTCNVWTGRVLQKAGIQTSLWTPFESSVFFYLP